jgi:hypothetical protein
MVQHSPPIIILSGNPLNAAIFAVLPLFLNPKITLLEPNQLTTQPKIPTKAILILNDTQITHLPNLRLHGFAGAALILSTNPHNNLLQTHRILRWGQGSHAIFTAPYSLLQLLQTIPTLIPLEPENLKMLQNELTAPKRWFKARILPTLKRLERDPQAIAEIADIITEIRAKTPVACHATTQIAGETAQIQQHFRRMIDRLQTAPQPETIAHLRQTFEQWRDLTLSGGEGLGTFS